MAGKELPRGFGYKSAWMVIEGKSQVTLKRDLINGGKKYPYDKGISLVCSSDAESNAIAITQKHANRCYVAGKGVYEFFYNPDAYLPKFREYSKVYVYLTDRISESHGFALCEYGEIRRLYFASEMGVKNIGEPLPEESFEGKLTEDGGSFVDSSLAEDDIIDLAILQTGITPSRYPYDDVFVGNLDLVFDEKNDFPPEGFKAMAIPEWVLNSKEAEEIKALSSLPELERFEAYLDLLHLWQKEGRAGHYEINLFWRYEEKGVSVPSYGRLNDRIDELECMLITTCSSLKWSRIEEKLKEKGIKLNPTVRFRDVKQFEKDNKIKLPPELKHFYEFISNGCEMKDGFKLYPFEEWKFNTDRLRKRFPFKEPYIWEGEKEDKKKKADIENGIIELIDVGCAQTWNIVVRGEGVGSMWFFTEVGIQPTDPVMGFRDWLETYIDEKDFF